MAAEKLFENKVKKFLEEQGAWHLKYWAGAAYTKAGIPDILCCVNGYFVALEIKAQNGTPSPLQIHTIEKIREAGGFAFVVYPSAFNELKEFIVNLKHDSFNRDLPIIMR